MDELDLFRSFRRGPAAPTPRRGDAPQQCSRPRWTQGRSGPQPRQSERRRRTGMFLVAAILVVGTASALAAAHEFFSVDPWTAHGKISRTVDGVRFSFTVPSHEQPYYKPDFGWMNGPAEKVGDSFRVRNLLMGTSILAGQAAEAVVFWTAFPDGGEAAPCPSLLGGYGPSTADLAAAMARRPVRSSSGARHRLRSADDLRCTWC